MSFRLLWGTLPRLGRRPPPSRAFSSSTTRQYRSRLPVLGLVSGVSVASYVWMKTSAVHADAETAADEHKNGRKATPLSNLIRAYAVYTMCSIPPLVDWSPVILTTLLSVPVISDITKAIVRVTFFDQFVGAETAEEALPLLEQFRAENKGCLFAYSVEVDEDEAAGKAGKGKNTPPVYKQIVQEMIHSIDVAADFEDKHLPPGSSKGRRTWVAVKLTALLPNHQSIINLSRYLVHHRPATYTPVPFPGTPLPTDLNVLYRKSSAADGILTEQDIVDLKDLHSDLNAICEHAQKRGVKLIIDAEYSWYQPAIDAFALALMAKYNRPSSSSSSPMVQPLVYNTYQAYLRRNQMHLAQSLETAKANGFALGVKLVRGAYHPHELAAHAAVREHSSTSIVPHALSISPEDLPPVWYTKDETDTCYNACVDILLDAITADVSRRSSKSWFGSSKAEVAKAPTVGVLFGTHNWGSCRLILDRLVQKGLAQAVGTTADGEAIVKVGSDVTERVTLAQLYGMHDNLTNYLVDRTRTSTPFVIKYVPYGSLAEVMPYLSRRAIENKSVLGNGAAAEERKRAWEEIKTRIIG